MKIKTRQDRLEEYNAKYTDRDYDPDRCLRAYFEERGWDLEKATKKAAKKLNRILESREYETIRVVFYEYPMKTDRPRTANGHTYSPNASANHDYFEKAIKRVTKAIKLITTPAEIEINAYLEMPAQVKPDEVILFEAKALDVVVMPDYDNISKCYTDMQKSVTILDDDIFHTGIVHKFYSVLPRVEMRVTYIKCHESDYIFKKLKSRKSVKEAIAAGRLMLEKLPD